MRALAVLMLLAAANGSACAPRPGGTGLAGPPSPGPGRAAAVLGSGEIRALAMLLRFEDRRVYDAAAFHALLERTGADQGEWEEVRRRAAMAAGRIGDPAATPFLTRLLESDPSSAVRADAAFALGEIGDSSSMVLKALEAAVPGSWTAPRDDEVPVVVEVIAALGKIGGERARALVRNALAEAGGSGSMPSARLGSVAAEALLTAWKFDDGPGNVRAAAPYLDSADPELRWRAAYSLMRGGDPTAVWHLLEHPTDEDHRVRAHTARALTAAAAAGADSMTAAGAEPRAGGTAGAERAARAWLTAALSDPHPHVRINAVRSLSGYGRSAPIDAIAELLRDPVPGVGVAAAGSLGGLGPRAAPHLAAPLSDPDLPLPLRGAIVEQLARVDPERAKAVLGRWAAGDAAHRYFAARALQALPPDAVTALVAALASDVDVRVAVAALGAAATLGSPDAPSGTRSFARRLLIGGLDSPDPVRRAAAVHGLAGAGRAEDLEALLAAFRRSAVRAGADPSAREAALATLSAIREIAARHGIPAPDVAARLFEGPPPGDRWVVRAAADFGEGWGGRPEAVAGEGLEFYEDVVRRYIAGPLAGEPRPRALIATSRGRITVELRGEEAPLTVRNFVELADLGFFDGGVWHRVIPNFVLQDGAPGGAAEGGPGWTIRDEINRVRYGRGVVGMALSGPDTGGSQWFITHSPQPHLDGGYTVFGRVIEGMEVAEAVLQGDPILTIRVRQ